MGARIFRSRFTKILSVVLLLVLPRAGFAQNNAPERSADAAAIRAHIESIFQAFVEKDRKKLEETHGANWRGFTPWSGHVIRGRDGYMNSATFPEGLPKGQGMIGYRIFDFDVVFYGDAAVASFVADLDVMNGTDKGTQKLTLVDVYHKEPAGWIQVASNTSLHPDEIGQQMSRLRALSEADRAALLAAREAAGERGSLETRRRSRGSCRPSSSPSNRDPGRSAHAIRRSPVRVASPRRATS